MGFRDQLNAYSRRFADRLFSAHPDWEGLARVEPWANADPGSFLVTVPSPGRRDRELWVGTDGGEVTVALGREWHEHHGPWSGHTEEASFAEALDQIDGILAERLIVAVGFKDGKAAVASLIEVGEDPRLLSEHVNQVEFYSWNGTYDSSVPA